MSKNLDPRINLEKLVIAFVSNSKLIDEIIKNITTKIDFSNYIKEGFLKRFPTDNYILSEESFHKNLFKSESPYDTLYFFARAFFSLKNMYPYIKEEVFHTFHFLSSSVDEYIFVIPHLIIHLESDHYFRNFFFENIQRFIPYIFFTEDFISFLKNDVGKIYDMHIHLGGSLRFEYRLNFLLRDPYINFKNIDKLSTQDLPESIILNNLCEKRLSDIFLLLTIVERGLFLVLDKKEKDLINILKLYLFDQKQFREKALEFIKNTEIYNIRKDELFYVYNFHKVDDLGKKFLIEARRHFTIKSENTDIFFADKLLLAFIIYTLKNTQNPLLSNIIWLYINLKNLFKGIYIQQYDREGLGYFSTYSKSKLRRDKINEEKNLILKSILLPSYLHKSLNLYIEGRITPYYKKTLTRKKNISLLKEDIQEYLTLFNEKKNLKIIFHFVKEEDKKKDWKTLKTKIKKQLFNILDFMEENPDYAELISGFDVAGKEYNTPPRIFAPVFRFLKSHQVFLNKNFNYTFHVGEDFPSLINGLRRVFEAILFLELGKNDRLSHAIALGINPEYVENNIFLQEPQEILYDLIFAYYLLDNNLHKILSLNLKDTYMVKINEIKKLINAYSRFLYGKEYNPDHFIKGWFLQRNCLHTLKDIKRTLDAFIPQRLQNEIFMRKAKTKKNIKHFNELFVLKIIFSDDIELQRDTLNLYLRKDKRIESFLFYRSSIPDFLDYDYTHYEELEMLHSIPAEAYEIFCNFEKGSNLKREKFSLKYIDELRKVVDNNLILFLQDLILEEYVAKRGIIIETLPTSNILTKKLYSIDKHPIFRFKPVDNNVDISNIGIRKSKVNLLLGSDNPGIQNTHILTEMALIYTYIKTKYGIKQAESYIKEIMEFSDKIFNLQ